MKVSKNLTEFFKKKDKELTTILATKFGNIVKYHPLEDLKASIYLRLHEKNYIENYRPLEISISPTKNIWNIKPTPAKFSTYIFTFVRNYLLAYFKKVTPDQDYDSFEDYKDTGFSRENETIKKIRMKTIAHPTVESSLYVEKILKHLEQKTRNKGTVICSDSLEKAIILTIEKHKKGCNKTDLIQEILKSQIFFKKNTTQNITGLEEIIFEDILKDLEKKGYLNKDKNSLGEDLYYVSNVERRSLYNLFKLYIKGYKDKEISEKFSMTVAGIGALKRGLRKEIKKFCKDSVL